ncbi:MAG: glutamate--tRNA ligase [Candidatus Wildermuthbacteria bacterium RIFCSPHIGHO2_02_FULL_47_12]|uniref:Glutamate--tRNA ligase n=1 Tax=Candidatus Wildermuthbacteria bacterium RIFCSPHIGHO2_02_FULL_47_12 TaxID=1802451 RepID=A0A1G2R3P8_9BACT|nr:MAG: glutamate--tRNA ligase [Candidatus Wildermuthbacteria bacterium RIFCSPHIGHO2_02_FULL_47_12]
MNVRTRFAPSPTGPLHMGNARTALFNYLFAKKEEGVFVLRVEDTDKERSAPEWEKDLLENLHWLGLEWDEGPSAPGQCTGEFGPYRQSERTKIYKEYLEKLLQEQKAYWCFCSAEDLEAQRQDQLSRGVAPKYKGTCRGLSKEEQEKQLQSGKPAIVRLLVPEKTVSFKDLIRGDIHFDMGLVGDIVLAKDLETPLYNFTVVIDDYLMKITHVIRGEDHISNTPKQMILEEALGFPHTIQYTHLPLILGEDRTKLSKRHGDNSVTRFRKEGYLPEAVVNFLALLGWNPGDEREIFSLENLVKEFSMDKVQKSNAVFNMQRLGWINGSYIRQKTSKELAELAAPYLPKASLDAIEKIVMLYKERLKKLSEIGELADFFFTEKLEYPKEMLKWKQYVDKDIEKALGTVEQILSLVPDADWTKEVIGELLLKEAEKTGDRGYLLWPMRVALTGKQASPGPFEVAEALEKEKTLARIKNAITMVNPSPHKSGEG